MHLPYANNDGIPMSNMTFTWLNPTKILFGAGTLSRLPEVIDNAVGLKSRVFLVTGQTYLRESGTLSKIVESIGDSRVTLFDRALPFPTPDLVDEASEACSKSSSDVVVAVGGGSALDLGKAAAILSTHKGEVRDYINGESKLVHNSLPFIAVPTTSGSSSEVTSGSTLWDMTNKRSMGLNSPLMFPTAAIVDPELTMSMNQNLAAVTGMDAFTSAFESYWSTESGSISDTFALDVIQLFNENLVASCVAGDIESRSSCALAATMSGVGYSNSPPNVCHAIGSPLTLYWGVEHGQAVGITLVPFLRWVAPVIEHKLPALYGALGVSNLEAAVNRIQKIMALCGLETQLSNLGIGVDEMDLLITNIRWDRMSVLPRPIDRNETTELLQGIF